MSLSLAEQLLHFDVIRCSPGDVQWNKNPVFNLCLTIGYFWTTLLVMIVLYIFIYGKHQRIMPHVHESLPASSRCGQ